MADKSKPTPAPSKPAYISGGNVLESPPLTARVSSFIDSSYNVMGLYIASLFSVDPYAAAQNSQFNTSGPGRVSNASRSQWGARGPGSANGGSGGGGGGNGGRRLGTLNDVRGGNVMPGPAGCSTCG